MPTAPSHDGAYAVRAEHGYIGPLRVFGSGRLRRESPERYDTTPSLPGMEPIVAGYRPTESEYDDTPAVIDRLRSRLQGCSTPVDVVAHCSGAHAVLRAVAEADDPPVERIIAFEPYTGIMTRQGRSIIDRLPDRITIYTVYANLTPGRRRVRTPGIDAEIIVPTHPAPGRYDTDDPVGDEIDAFTRAHRMVTDPTGRPLDGRLGDLIAALRQDRLPRTAAGHGARRISLNTIRPSRDPRSTMSTTSASTGAEKPGMSRTNVWNAPSSPQGSTSSGRSARNDRS